MISFTPKGLRYLWKQRSFWRLAKRGPEEIFTDVYSNNIWGGKKGDFYSGAGSTNPNTEMYVRNLVDFIEQRGITRIVELGCGDFRIMRRVLAITSVQYIGFDIVKDLVDFNTDNFGSDQIKFQHLNIIDDALPKGDLVIIRQVLQHLNNSEIIKILDKISLFPWALITEQIPVQGQIDYNLDKIHGPHIRLKVNSGVFIDKPPFNVRNSSVLFEYREDEIIKGKSVPAVIRTYCVSRPIVL